MYVTTNLSFRSAYAPGNFCFEARGGNGELLTKLASSFQAAPEQPSLLMEARTSPTVMWRPQPPAVTRPQKPTSAPGYAPSAPRYGMSFTTFPSPFPAPLILPPSEP